MLYAFAATLNMTSQFKSVYCRQQNDVSSGSNQSNALAAFNIWNRNAAIQR